jgi:hypothetical protein
MAKAIATGFSGPEMFVRVSRHSKKQRIVVIVTSIQADTTSRDSKLRSVL